MSKYFLLLGLLTPLGAVAAQSTAGITAKSYLVADSTGEVILEKMLITYSQLPVLLN